MSLLENADYLADLDSDLTNVAIGDKWRISETSVRRHKKQRLGGLDAPTQPSGESETHSADGSSSYVRFSQEPWGYDDYCEFIKTTGQDPTEVTFTWGWTSNPTGGFWNKLNNVRPKTVAEANEPAWPVIQPGPPLVITPIKPTPRNRKWKTAVLMADTQIGFRRYDDGTLDPFHDEAAISVALQIVQIENPDRTVVMGDIIDMAEQGRFAQEAAFANTTQAAIDRTTEFGGQMRAATNGEIDWIEGNHDLRLQHFVEANTKAAFGLRKGGLPDSWPVMSLPNLLRLDETGITYHDAYPAAHIWINNRLRCEHGTKVNSGGSTVAKYANETPHISTASGHTHRQEAQGKTTFDRMGKIVSMHINPGCLCRVDGAVPSVKGAIGANGRPAEAFENWQQGVAVVRYLDDDFRVELVQIIDGMTFYQGQEIVNVPGLI